MQTVGVTSGASVPEVLVRDVLTYLAERGYEDVEPVVAAEESLLFALPNEIRRDLKAATARTQQPCATTRPSARSAHFTERRSRVPA